MLTRIIVAAAVVSVMSIWIAAVQADEAKPGSDALLVVPKGQAGAKIDRFVTVNGGSARQATQASVTWDDSGLTVVFDCVDDQVNAEQRTRDNADIWKDDCVEIFIDPSHSHDYQTKWLHVIVTASGAVFDEQGGAVDWGTHADNGSLRAGHISYDAKGLRTAVEKTDKGWRTHVLIPWEDIGSKPKPGDLWGVNFCRSDYPGDDYTCWSPTRGPFHQLHNWGHILFTEGEADEASVNKARARMATMHARLKGGPGMVNGALLMPTAENPDPTKLPTLSVWVHRSLQMVAVEFPEVPGLVADAWCYEGPRENLGVRELPGGVLELRHGYDEALVMVTRVIPEPGAVEFRCTLERREGSDAPLPESIPHNIPNLCLHLWRSPQLANPGEHYSEFVKRCFIYTGKGRTFLHETRRGPLPNQPLDNHAQKPLPWVQSYLAQGEPPRAAPSFSSFNYSEDRFVVPIMGQVTLDGRHIVALASDSAIEMIQAWHNCFHNYAQWQPTDAPLLKRTWRLKLYATQNDPAKLLERVKRDFSAINLSSASMP